MQKDLVTILTPCYNTGVILHRLFDSILMQDYPLIEMFAINDGSTDNTEETIKSYIPKFEAKGYKLTYIYQNNSGQSAAINSGLKLVNGEYLVWPDSDDFYRSATAISTLVSELANHEDEYAIARALPTFVSENDCRDISNKAISVKLRAENQFLNCLYSCNFIWPPINYMVRMKAFDKVNPEREIYVEKDAGQNWQMFLPLLYSYKCVTINKHLGNVLTREMSHSRGQYRTYEQQLKKNTSYRNTILYTIDKITQIPDSEKLKYKKEIIYKYKLIELELSILFGKREAKRRLISELKADKIKHLYKDIFILKLRMSLIGKFIRKIKEVFRFK